MSISDRDDNNACLNYDSNYNIEFPTISGVEGHGNVITNNYNIGGFPTYILIAPDHSILEKDMYPINDVNTFITYLNNHGISQSACETGVTKQEIDNILSVYPNPSTGIFNLNINYSGKTNIKVSNILGVTIMEKQIYVNDNLLENIDLSNNKDGIYFITISTNNYSIVKKIELKK